MEVVRAKRDFGSFMSSNVGELIKASEDLYIPPKFPFELPSFALYHKDQPQFGKRMKEKHFYLEPDWTFINHGAFGCSLREAIEVSQKWQIHVDRQPVRFMDRELLPHLVHVVRRIAKYIGCEPSDLVLTRNATSANNAVLRSFQFKEGDLIYRLNTTYGATKKLLSYLGDLKGVNIQEEEVTFPLNDEKELIDLVDKTLKPGTRLATFDHIPSNQAYITPVKEIINICHKRGVPVCIDGAHVLGNLPINLRDLGADFYLSNAHKWFCNPKGCAFLYISPDYQSSCHPAVISHGYGSGLHGEFLFSGLQDYSPYLAMHTTMDFWEAIGKQRVHQYCQDVLSKAANLLTEAWKSSLLVPLHMCGTMAVVKLPEIFYKDKKIVYEDAEQLQNILYHQYKIEVPFKVIQGQLYVRISVHIYNELTDYQRLADVILELKTEMEDAASSAS